MQNLLPADSTSQPLTRVPFHFEGSATFGHIPLSTGVSLQVTTFIPARPANYPPVILVPGLFSVMENFLHLLQALTVEFKVYFIETREKKSSLCNKGTDFSIPAMAMDLSEILRELKFDERDYILIGYSLGATVALESFSTLAKKPVLTVLVDTPASIHFPAWSLFLAKFAAPIFTFVKPVVKGYIRYFRVNRKEDPEMHNIQSRALDGADAYKLCATIPAIHGFSIWERLKPLSPAVLIIGASKDTFHNHDDSLSLSRVIPGCIYIDMETNQRNHSIEVVQELKRTLQNFPVNS